MKRIEPGHWQFGIYHARKQADGSWLITIEDGKGFPFEPQREPTLNAVRRWMGC